MYLKLRLIRHPKPQVAPGICYGATDLPAEEGALHAFVTQCAAMPVPDIVLSSPLQRCATPAKLLEAHGWPQAAIHPELAEMNFGQWEMRPWREIERGQIDAWAANMAGYVPPGGESVAQVGQRALRAVKVLLGELSLNTASIANEPMVAVICHSGVIQGVSHALSGEPWSAFKPRDLPYGFVQDLPMLKSDFGES